MWHLSVAGREDILTDQERVQLSIELGLIRSVLSTLIAWLAQSSTGVISPQEARTLLDKLESINDLNAQ